MAKLRGVMAQLRFPPVRRSLPELRYVRAPEPLDFPEDALMPESKTHLVLRTFLFRLLRFALGPAHRVGSEQFLYWNAADTSVSLAPDAMVRLNVPDAQFPSWKTWEEGGVPDLAVEIVSDSDRRKWDEKFPDYRAIGVRELVRFDPAAPEGKRLRVWDRVREDLVERLIGEDRTPCLTLGLNWIVPRGGRTGGAASGRRRGTLARGARGSRSPPRRGSARPGGESRGARGGRSESPR
jgi:Uma2 family endonuclease